MPIQLDIFCPELELNPDPGTKPKLREVAGDIHQRLEGKGFYVGAASLGIVGFRYRFSTPIAADEAMQSLTGLPLRIERTVV